MGKIKPYVKTDWVPGVTPVTRENMTNIEEQVESITNVLVEASSTDKSAGAIVVRNSEGKVEGDIAGNSGTTTKFDKKKLLKVTGVVNGQVQFDGSEEGDKIEIATTLDKGYQQLLDQKLECFLNTKHMQGCPTLRLGQYCYVINDIVVDGSRLYEVTDYAGEVKLDNGLWARIIPRKTITGDLNDLMFALTEKILEGKLELSDYIDKDCKTIAEKVVADAAKVETDRFPEKANAAIENMIITTPKIADGAVTSEKIENSLLEELKNEWCYDYPLKLKPNLGSLSFEKLDADGTKYKTFTQSIGHATLQKVFAEIEFGNYIIVARVRVKTNINGFTVSSLEGGSWSSGRRLFNLTANTWSIVTSNTITIDSTRPNPAFALSTNQAGVLEFDVAEYFVVKIPSKLASYVNSDFCNAIFNKIFTKSKVPVYSDFCGKSEYSDRTDDEYYTTKDYLLNFYKVSKDKLDTELNSVIESLVFLNEEMDMSLSAYRGTIIDNADYKTFTPDVGYGMAIKTFPSQVSKVGKYILIGRVRTTTGGTIKLGTTKNNSWNVGGTINSTVANEWSLVSSMPFDIIETDGTRQYYITCERMESFDFTDFIVIKIKDGVSDEIINLIGKENIFNYIKNSKDTILYSKVSTTSEVSKRLEQNYEENLKTEIGASVEARLQETSYKGKIILCIGDSITEYGQYHRLIKEYFEMSEVINNGHSGATVESFEINEANVNRADFITVYGAINNTTAYKDSLESYIAKWRVWLDRLITVKPTANILIIGTHWGKTNQVPPDTTVDGTHYLWEYNKALGELCMEYSLQYLNLMECVNINKFNTMTYTRDGLHPILEGDKKIANCIIQKMLSMEHVVV